MEICFPRQKEPYSSSPCMLLRSPDTRPPWCRLLGSPDRKGHARPPPDKTTEMSLWVLHGGRLRKLRSRARFHPEEKIVGSSQGWLVVTFHTRPGMHLMNPVSNERIRLPSEVPGEVGNVQIQSCWASDEHFVRRESRWVKKSVFVVHRVVISSAPTTGDCVLVASGIYEDRSSNGFLWCRVDEEQWSAFHEEQWSARPWSPENRFLDTMFYDGKLYFLGSRGEVVVYAFDPEPKIVVRSCITSNACNYNRWQLVESDREILALVQYDQEEYIFRQEGDGQWARVDSLGDRILLKGGLGIAAVYPEDLIGSEFEASCTYYSWAPPSYTSFTYRRCRGKPALMKFSPASLGHQCVSSFPLETCCLRPEGEWIISPIG